MAVTAQDRTNVATNSGIVERMVDFLIEHSNFPGNAPLTNHQWINVIRISQHKPSDCTEAQLLASVKAMIDEIQ